MRQHSWAIVLLALMLSACGATAIPEQPASAPTQAASTGTLAPTAEAATTAPTEAGQASALTPLFGGTIAP